MPMMGQQIAQIVSFGGKLLAGLFVSVQQICSIGRLQLVHEMSKHEYLIEELLIAILDGILMGLPIERLEGRLDLAVALEIEATSG